MELLLFLMIIFPCVLIHELGHYLVGLWLRGKPTVFSIGFGAKPIYKFTFKGTEFQIRPLPLGGFVKFDTVQFEWENTEAKKYAKEKFDAKAEKGELKEGETFTAPKDKTVLSPWKWMLIALAGPFTNFLSVIVLGFIAVFITYNNSSFYTVESLKANQETIVLKEKVKDKDVMGKIQVGDTVVYTPKSIFAIIPFHGSNKHHINSKGKLIIEHKESLNYEQKTLGLKLVKKDIPFTTKLTSSAKAGVGLFVFISDQIVNGLKKIRFSNIQENVGGPLAIADQAGDVYEKAGGRGMIVMFIGFSVFIGLLNLIPLPAFDGGRFMIALMESIIRRPLPEKAVKASFIFSNIAILSLMVFAIGNDIWKFIIN